jgi:plasmid replication initiation protein
VINKSELEAIKEASVNLTEIEHRLLELVYLKTIAKGSEISVLVAVRIEAVEYQLQFGCSLDVACNDLKKATNRLFERAIIFSQINANGNIECIKSRWVGQIAIEKTGSFAELIFAPLIARASSTHILYKIPQTI